MREAEAEALYEAVGTLDGEGDALSWDQVKAAARKGLAVASIAARLAAAGSGNFPDKATVLRDDGTVIDDTRRRRHEREVKPKLRSGPVATGPGSGDRETPGALAGPLRDQADGEIVEWLNAGLAAARRQHPDHPPPTLRSTQPSSEPVTRRWDPPIPLVRRKPAQPHRDGAPATLRSRIHGGEAETGWDIALRRSGEPATAVAPAAAREARQRIRMAAAAPFSAALDRLVDPDLLAAFAAKHPGGVDAAKLRAAFVADAVRRFAAEFTRLVTGGPPAAAEDIALGAVVAVAIAETTHHLPIVKPEAIAPMAVLVTGALRSRMAALIRLAAAAVPAAAPPAREMAL